MIFSQNDGALLLRDVLRVGREPNHLRSQREQKSEAMKPDFRSAKPSGNIPRPQQVPALARARRSPLCEWQKPRSRSDRGFKQLTFESISSSG
jgi:hypothetical protein